MRKMIVIANEQYVRNLVEAGAFDGIEDDETFFVTDEKQVQSALTPRRGGHAGWTVKVDKPRHLEYIKLRQLMLASYRFRSRTQKIKLQFVPPRERRALKLRSLPPWRDWFVRRHLRSIGRNEKLHTLMQELQPDIVIAPSGGVDHLTFDALRSAQELGIFSLLLIFNWDNLSSKGAFPHQPDHFAVVGPQSVNHAWRIHRVPGDRVSVLGGPYIDSYFHLTPGATQSPFPFRYVLFAGCYMPFDELTALRRLDDAIEAHGLDMKIVYRPHPQRRPRKVDDRVRDTDLRHVVIDPQVRDEYLAMYGQKPDWSREMPALSYYPALLENAEFVVCPLSTMVLESAIFERRVAVIAYHDGIHQDSPGIVVDYDHFQGMDQMGGLMTCRTEADLVPTFLRLAVDPPPLAQTMRSEIAPWIFHDERPYSRRLAELVDELADSHGFGDTRPTIPPAAKTADVLKQ